MLFNIMLTGILSTFAAMSDTLSKSERSYRMSLVRSSGTKPEQRVWAVVKALRVGGSLNDRRLPGSPDIVFHRRRKVLFVHGCFWHGHAGCAQTRTPKSNMRFWTEKFTENQSRDRRVVRQLRQHGWGVMTVWECQTLNAEKLSKRIINFLQR